MQIFSIKNEICFWDFENLQGCIFQKWGKRIPKSEKMHETDSVSIFGSSGKKSPYCSVNENAPSCIIFVYHLYIIFDLKTSKYDIQKGKKWRSVRKNSNFL